MAARGSESEFLFQDFVDRLRARFAAGRLHHLADEPTDRLWIGLGVGNLVRIFGDDVVDGLFDRADVGDLLHAALNDDRARIATLVPDNLEQILSDFSGDRIVADQIEDGAELRGGDR